MGDAIVFIAGIIGRRHLGVSADEPSLLMPYPGRPQAALARRHLAGSTLARRTSGIRVPLGCFHIGKTRFRHVKCNNAAAQQVVSLG